MQSTEISILTFPSELRQHIISLLSLGDALNVMETSKDFAQDLSRDYKQIGARHKSLLESLIEKRVWEKIHELYPLFLTLNEKEDPWYFLYNDLTLEQKKWMHTIICKYTKIHSKPKSSAQLFESFTRWDEPMNLMKKQFSKSQFLTLYPPVLNPPPYLPFSDKVKDELAKTSPLLIFLAYILSQNKIYLYLSLYATNGKDMLTIRNLFRYGSTHPTFFDPLHNAIYPSVYEKIKALFLSRFKLSANEIESKSFPSLKNLFLNSHPEVFDLVFPILYDTFNNNLDEINKFLPIIEALLSIPTKLQEWHMLYAKEKLSDLIKRDTFELYILLNLSKKHHEYLFENPALMDKLKRLSTTTLPNGQPPTLNSLMLFSKFLEHYFELTSIEETLDLQNLTYFLASMRDKNELYLNKLYLFSLDLLNIFPLDLIEKFDFVFEAHFKAPSATDSTYDAYYKIIYGKLWLAANDKSEFVSTELKNYLFENKPNLNKWRYNYFTKLSVETLRKINSIYLEIMHPALFASLYYMISAGATDSPKDIEIMKFINNAMNHHFVQILSESLAKNVGNIPREMHFDYLRQLKGTEENDILAILDSNAYPSIKIEIFLHKLIKFEHGKTYVHPGLLPFIQPAFLSLISSSEFLMTRWFNYIFQDYNNQKINDLQKITTINMCVEHKKLLLNFFSPEEISLLTPEDLGKLTSIQGEEEFLVALRNMNKPIAVNPKNSPAKWLAFLKGKKRAIEIQDNESNQAGTNALDYDPDQGNGKRFKSSQ